MHFSSFLAKIEERIQSSGKLQKEIGDAIGFSQGAISYYVRASIFYGNPNLAEIIGRTDKGIFFGDDMEFSVVFENWDKLSKNEKKLIASHVEVLVDAS